MGISVAVTARHGMGTSSSHKDQSYLSRSCLVACPVQCSDRIQTAVFYVLTGGGHQSPNLDMMNAWDQLAEMGSQQQQQQPPQRTLSPDSVALSMHMQVLDCFPYLSKNLSPMLHLCIPQNILTPE